MTGQTRLFAASGWTAIAMAASMSAQTPAPPRGVEALGAIVGVWQSDVTGGVSALSSCAWTPQHSAVVCDQTVMTPEGVQHATNLYEYDPATDRYAYYGVTHVGDTLSPVPLTIAGPIWTYGGQTAGPDGVTYRTINDFSGGSFYTWRRESSRDGKTWTVVAQGRSEKK